MSIRPIDMQIAVPRSTETNRTGSDSARPDLAAQNFTREFQRRVDTEQRQVNETFRSEGQEVDKDGRRKQEREKKEKEKKEKEKRAEALRRAVGGAKNEPPAEYHFDISV